jgi:isoamylase
VVGRRALWLPPWAIRADLSSDERDGAAYGPLGVVIDPAFAWGDDRPPRTPWHKPIIYEVRVKEVSQLHPEVPEKPTAAGR